jgi:hypothetical protein
MSLDEVVQVIQDLALAFCEWNHVAHGMQREGESQQSG